MRCYDDGALRAYLDAALPSAEHAAIAEHTAGCATCRTRLERQRTLATRIGALLAAPIDGPDPRLALARLRENNGGFVVRSQWSIASDKQPPAADASQHVTRRNSMRTSASFWSGPRRSLFAGMAAIVILLSLLALPPVRAAADQLLQIFRVQKVVFVPISPERIEQLKQLNFDGKTLFVGEPKLVNQPAQPRTVDSADAAASAVGFPISQPSVFPSAPTSTQHVVHDRAVMQFQVNVASARQLLALLKINDVTLPDSLATKPITADAPAFAETRYQGAGYTMTLYQGHSPSVALPEGVDLKQLGKAGLRLLGMDANAAEKMSQQIDWSSTFIFPFPKDIRDIREVQIGNTQGLLVGEGRGAGRHWQLYWQNGDRFSMLEGTGNVDDADVIAAAESVR
jgi:anti-sigma factor RsiW